MREPTIEAYRSVDDLIQLRQWFYDPESPDQKHRAVLRVNALTSRAAKLPHGVTITALLMSLQLKDTDLDSLESEYAMQLGYTAALIRFVNGLLDPFQKSVHAAPLYRLAHQIDLPGFFVELRHWGTHEQMALLELLRVACNQALEWLKKHYWDVLGSEITVPNNIDDEDEENAIKLAKSALTSYKRIRKANLSMVYKYGDGSETGVKYWKAVKNLKLIDTTLLQRVLIYNDYLIYNSEEKTSQGKGTKFNPLLIKLYRPLIDELGLVFKYELLMKILDARETVGTIEWNQLLEWSAFLVGDITEYSELELKDTFSEELDDSKDPDIKRLFLQQMILYEFKSDPKYLKWLNSLKSWLKGSKLKLVVIAEITKENSKAIEQFALPPSLDDIISGATPSTTTDESNTNTSEMTVHDDEGKDDEPPRKKHKSRARSLFILEPIPDWKPTPMGIVP